LAKRSSAKPWSVPAFITSFSRASRRIRTRRYSASWSTAACLPADFRKAPQIGISAPTQCRGQTVVGIASWRVGNVEVVEACLHQSRCRRTRSRLPLRCSQSDAAVGAGRTEHSVHIPLYCSGLAAPQRSNRFAVHEGDRQNQYHGRSIYRRVYLKRRLGLKA
jgi:hypothetical protein